VTPDGSTGGLMNNNDEDHRETRALLRTLDAGMGEERERRKDEGADGDLNVCSRKMMVPPLRVEMLASCGEVGFLFVRITLVPPLAILLPLNYLQSFLLRSL